MPTRLVRPNPQVPFEILHQEAHFAVVFKPAGVVTQPSHNEERDSLLNGLAVHFAPQLSALGAKRDFGLLHRLDRGTSGLVLVSLSAQGYDALRAQFAEKTLKKTYVTLVRGQIRPASGEITASIAEQLRDGRKYAKVLAGRAPLRGQSAFTRWRTLTQSGQDSLLECEIETGRLHQIRAHLAHLGHPVHGDRDYGPRDERLSAFRRLAGKALFLHAGELSFNHPTTGRRLTISRPLPERLVAALETWGLRCPRRWAGPRV